MPFAEKGGKFDPKHHLKEKTKNGDRFAMTLIVTFNELKPFELVLNTFFYLRVQYVYSSAHIGSLNRQHFCV